MGTKIGVLLVTALAASLPGISAFADPPLTLRGFGTLGVARSDDDNAEYIRDLSQAHGVTNHWSLQTDSLIGVQGNLALESDLEAVVQIVARHGSDDSFKPELSWAFLRYDPTPTWSVRAGRLGTEFYMLADSRMVGYSYVTVRPPTDYYGTLPFSFIDGLDLGFATPLATGLLRTKLYAGMSGETSPWENLSFNMRGSLLVGGYLDYLAGPWLVRIGHAAVQFEHDLPLESFYRALPSQTADELRVKHQWSSFSSLGIAYDDGPLQAQLMVSRTTNDHAAFQNTWAGYLILSYGLGEFRPFLGLSAAKSDPKRLDYPAPPYTDAYQSEFFTDQHTIFAGARWDFLENICLKAQADVIRGSADSRFLYRWETSEWDGSMTVFSVALDFVF